MSLIIATGSNLGEKEKYLLEAKLELQKHFSFINESRIYCSEAVDYTDQPDFYNQVLEFEIPKDLSPKQTMLLLLNIEKEMGRRRDIPKGPRTIDLDILFFGLEKINTDIIHVPHPRLFERSFVVLPLMELPFFKTLEKHYDFSHKFNISARPVVF